MPSRLDDTTATGSRSVNRATQFGYAPGSTFKVVTATAAIDTGAYTPESTVERAQRRARSPGVPLQNDNNESFGQITLTDALAQLGQHRLRAGGRAARQARRSRATWTASASIASRSSTTRPKRCPRAASTSANAPVAPTSPLVDVGRMGIGQDKLEVTPLQMAEVAAAVANHGTLMVPHLTQRIVDAEGRTVQTITPRVQSVVMKPSTAAAVTSMMEAVVNEGTGTAAQIPGVHGGRQDRHRRDADRQRDQQRLVHRVRARRRPARWRSR